MRKIILISSFILASLAGFSQSPVGSWYGILNNPGAPLHVVFHITQNGNDLLTTMDSPDQGAKGLETDQTKFDGKQLTITASKFALKYTGTYLPDSNKINGTFSQGAASFPMVLSSQAKPLKTTAAKRPQDPVSFPYKQEEVSFINHKAGNRLAGTLTLPNTGKVKKAVILISGSGPQNRNEEAPQFNHRPFLVWSDWLTRNGIAVLRYDDRGVGQSTGDFNNATSADFAQDAMAAANYLKSRADMKGVSIGLMGHSEGGMIAPMVAADNKALSFVVLLAAPGIPVTDLMEAQNADQMRLSGAPDSVIKASGVVNRTLFTAMNQYKDLSAALFKTKMDSVIQSQIRNSPGMAMDEKSIQDAVQKISRQVNATWFRYFISYKPSEALQKLSCPVLALNGTKDSQVKAETNLTGIKQALTKAGNKHFEVLPLPGLNHLFQKAGTGAVSEYAQLSETVNPAALDKVLRWINQLK